MNFEKKNILHITPHLGGGVGSVVLNYIKHDVFFNHKIICLDYANEKAEEFAKSFGLQLFSNLSSNPSQIIELIKKADIVLVHYWNHPLLYDFIIRNEFPLSRVIFWSHTSGICPPHNFTHKVLCYPDKFVFNTSLAFENPEVRSLPIEQKEKIKVVWATGGISFLEDIIPTCKDQFCVGYIGTVDYCRLRRDFLHMYSKVKIPNVKFIVCGGLKEKEIQQEAQSLGISEKFEFTGKINDVRTYLQSFDVFAYPLVANHSGTCDLVLQEAMAAGVVPVVFDNPMEKSIVIDGYTGYVVKTKEEYIDAIEKLYKNPELRNRLSANAKKYAIENFSINKLVEEWKVIFDDILLTRKSSKKWQMESTSAKIEYKDIFLEALGDYSLPFRKYLDKESKQEGMLAIKELSKMQIWQGDSKSTVHQYFHFFNNDDILGEWSRIMKED